MGELIYDLVALIASVIIAIVVVVAGVAVILIWMSKDVD